jgi:acyl carrier protein
MERALVVEVMQSILERQGKGAPDLNESSGLREIGFRSLDFSELCLRVEETIGRELNFDASTLRTINTVQDVCDFILQAAS